MPDRKRAAFAVIGGLALFALVEALIFYLPLYRGLLDPQSSTGAFEAAIARLSETRTDARRDVLVLGDSRIYSGLDPSLASAASGGRLRFLDGSVPGTTPRCWWFFARAVDPQARRFRAIVIPVDTYADDDSAIGSLDGDQRRMDLHYIVLRVAPSDIPKLAASFGDWRARLNAGTDLALRGPLLRDDVQALAADPLGRLRAVARGAAGDLYDPLAAHPRIQTLRGLRVDFARGRIAFPRGVGAAERSAIAEQVLHVAAPSPSYAHYRRRWLGPLVERYASAGVPVIFVRIPTRPVHRASAPPPSGSLLDFARAGATLLPQTPYLALERPRLFADHDHLNAAGSRAFSAQLGHDVARALAGGAPRAAPATSIVAQSAGEAPARGGIAHAIASVLSIGAPLPFQTYEFWIFFTLTALCFYAAAGKLRWLVALAASYYFYARWNGWYVVFLWLLTASDYAIGILLERVALRRKKLTLAVGVAANLLFLGTFKYANFASGTIAALVGMRYDPWLVNLFVPIGISFHTFQSMSYLIDVYRGKMRAVHDPLGYALYLAFFPQLLAGPIVRAGLFFTELTGWRRPNAADAAYGAARIAFGLVKKICVADQFAPIADAYFGAVSTHPGSLAAVGAIFAFSMQIYFDFSGYSDIAIGCARLFGFVFPENFAQPYLAASVTEFWHRWHITLSTWLRDYLYISLGGSRAGMAATLRNLMLTMLLGGLWHGAQWTFVAWGGVHGIFLCVERVFGIGRPGDRPGPLLRYLRIALTFAAVSLAWVLFRAPGFAAAAEVYRQLATGGWQGWALSGWPAVLALGLIAFALVRIARPLGRLPSWRGSPIALQATAIGAALLALELFSWPGAPATFIYFKF